MISLLAWENSIFGRNQNFHFPWMLHERKKSSRKNLDMFVVFWVHVVCISSREFMLLSMLPLFASRTEIMTTSSTSGNISFREETFCLSSSGSGVGVPDSSVTGTGGASANFWGSTSLVGLPTVFLLDLRATATAGSLCLKFFQI